MKKLMPLFSCLGLFLLISCSSTDGDETPVPGPGEPGGNPIADITGNWRATSAVFDIAFAGGPEQIDAVAEGGEVLLNIQASGVFTYTVVIGENPPDIITGRLAFEGTTVLVTFDANPGVEVVFDIQSTATTLSVEGPIVFDFDADGTAENADADLDFVKL
ncbi:hypothetical protein WIW50_18440 [Flavobacteriaceae bacterium 3-367]|uniref:hypothetical protein n=1 Tax=Eudoraea algarum TaxID=3417568 RepID=UPI00328BD322